MITSFNFDSFGFINNIHGNILVKDYLDCKQDFTMIIDYDLKMNEEAKNFAGSLKILMEYYGDNQQSLAKKSGISQKTVSNMLNPGDDRSPTLANIALVAAAYKIKAWRIIMPNISMENLLVHQTIDGLSPSRRQEADNFIKFLASQENTPIPENNPLTPPDENVGGGDERSANPEAEPKEQWQAGDRRNVTPDRRMARG